jgi:UDP-N-acetylglucosamine--N-acetylmuramyl-(pentapeptide) pyrophosphoryl-undecaprenol N-acetylglucosamine transferase
MNIIFSGGGTLGSVTPLLAMYDEFKSDKNNTFLWVATVGGLEIDIVKRAGMRTVEISSGKFRRYFSLRNFIDIFRFFVGFVESIFVVWRHRPDVCITAGGYVSVPLHMSAWILGIPAWVHQQDVRVGLANRIMSKMATTVTVALEDSLRYFSKNKTVWMGNPVREDVLHGNKRNARQLFGITSSLPVVFVTGGGTGAYSLNHLVAETVQNLDGVCEIIHLTGKGRSSTMIERAAHFFSNYHVFNFFLEEMKHAYALADIVITRGGFGTLSELATLEKCTVVVPKSGHQDGNVQHLREEGAVIVLNDQTTSGHHLSAVIKDLLEDSKRREAMGKKFYELIPSAKPVLMNKILKKLES